MKQKEIVWSRSGGADMRARAGI